MTPYAKLSAEERKAEYARLRKEFDDLKAKGLQLNMARGKPGKNQLDMVSEDLFNTEMERWYADLHAKYPVTIGTSKYLPLSMTLGG